MASDKKPGFQVKDLCIYTGQSRNPMSERKVCRITAIKSPAEWKDNRIPEYQIVLLLSGVTLDATEQELMEIK